MKRFILGFALLLAAGCDRPSKLYSETILFHYRDPAAVLKPGLWLWEREGCPVDVRQPTYQWEDCAETANIGDGWTGDLILRYPFVIAAGNPRVMQIEYAGDYVGYDYIAALEMDTQGQVVAMYREPLACTIEPALAPGEPPPAGGFPMVPGAPCPVKDAAAVLRVAADAAAGPAKAPNFRWVREKPD